MNIRGKSIKEIKEEMGISFVEARQVYEYRSLKSKILDATSLDDIKTTLFNIIDQTHPGANYEQTI